MTSCLHTCACQQACIRSSMPCLKIQSPSSGLVEQDSLTSAQNIVSCALIYWVAKTWLNLVVNLISPNLRYDEGRLFIFLMDVQTSLNQFFVLIFNLQGYYVKVDLQLSKEIVLLYLFKLHLTIQVSVFKNYWDLRILCHFVVCSRQRRKYLF